MRQVMQTLESVTYYRMRLVKSLYDKLGTLAAPSIASFTACDKPRNLSAQCVCPETARTSPPLPTPISHSPSSIPASIAPLSLPSEGIFDSFDQLYDACQQHARLAGYAFTTANIERLRQ
jgi:hypothetical protein